MIDRKSIRTPSAKWLRLLSLLRPGGYFLVGHSETLNGINETLRPVQLAVYRKT
ncbi:MAG: hypothetical protein Q7U38_03545 [Methylobacter sp.]|nr:hypothetical protein [Methylobacter sp.]MDP2098645.1 hypothetical protein [Methylobacter sp.]MDP2429852.1 hypothetical protein [Methylobacter sp.]MDP3054757.1 hypothetical protein [Methylobacter sp.]MDP3362213.1 hypothetical protein [Methylobacter sp.]